jgi:hypothetical protein
VSGSATNNVTAQSAGSDYANHAALVRSILSRVSTAMPAMVQAVSSPAGLNPVGYVDVLPLVNQLDGNGQPTVHNTVYHLPYARLQGGANAVIIDPAVGDIGIVVFASHDISSVKSTKKQSNPGSRRRFNMADGIYIGGILNGTPTQYVIFDNTGITVHSPTAIVLSAPNVTLDASGNLGTKGEITAKTGASSVNMTQHQHGTGTAAAGTSVPTPGT